MLHLKRQEGETTIARTVLSIGPGLFSDDTPHAKAGSWANGSNIRFRLGLPQSIDGWEALTADLLDGLCRWIFGWSTNDNQLHFAFGTHEGLQVWVGGGLYNITPAFAQASHFLGANPLAVANGSPLVTVTQQAHSLSTGDSVNVSGATAIGGIMPNGTFVVTVVDPSTYTYTYTASATSTATGGGSAIVVQPTEAFVAGQVDGTGQAGYGTGPYGAGGYATPSVDEYFPRTWSGGAFGENLIASPRLGAIYQWDAGDVSAPATPLRNAPNRVTYCLVAHTDQVFALGCNEEASGAYNALCIRHSSVRKAEEWSTTGATTAREYVLPGGGRIVAGRTIGSSLLVWTNAGLFLGSYVGQLGQVWRFDKVGDRCGLIGPGAAAVIGQQAFWISPDRQFWSYAPGGEPQPMACPIREDFSENLAAAQADKIVASSVGQHGEIWWDYPDSRDGYENSRYVAVTVLGPDAGAWHRGQMSRTARVDAGPGPYPLAVTPEGQIYWHERGHSADGAPLTWFIETADQFFSEDTALLARAFWPDAQNQVGPVTLTVTTRFKPRGEETVRTYVFSSEDEKIDLRAAGRLFRLKFSGAAAPSSFRLGRPVIDMTPIGAR
jgi:hypothetical protein